MAIEVVPDVVAAPPPIVAVPEPTLAVIVMFSPEELSSVMPSAAGETHSAVTPVLEEASLMAFTAAARPSALIVEPIVKVTATAVVLFEVMFHASSCHWP